MTSVQNAGLGVKELAEKPIDRSYLLESSLSVLERADQASVRYRSKGKHAPTEALNIGSGPVC
jgi:hypothetical protein